MDPENDPALYRRLENDTLRAALELGYLNRRNVLRAVFETVTQRLSYSKSGVQETLRREAVMRGQTSLPRGSLVDLSVHLRASQGVCRHQALACGWLMQRFIAWGELSPVFSIDNNEIVSPQRELEGHVWARHTEPGLEPSVGVTILDVAQNFRGSLGDSFESATWNYGRPDELYLPSNTLDPALIQS